MIILIKLLMTILVHLNLIRSTSGGNSTEVFWTTLEYLSPSCGTTELRVSPLKSCWEGGEESLPREIKNHNCNCSTTLNLWALKVRIVNVNGNPVNISCPSCKVMSLRIQTFWLGSVFTSTRPMTAKNREKDKAKEKGMRKEIRIRKSVRQSMMEGQASRGNSSG